MSRIKPECQVKAGLSIREDNTRPKTSVLGGSSMPQANTEKEAKVNGHDMLHALG